jgi:HlyD family secretion protein
MKLLSLKNLGKRKIAVIIICIIAVGIFAAVNLSGSSAKISTFKVKKGDFVIDIVTSGEIQASKSVSVSVPPDTWGDTRIVSLIPDGTHVKEGDLLVKFDTSETEDRVKSRQNDLDNALADLSSIKANIESTKKQMENSYLTQTYSYEQSKLRYEQMKYEAEARKREQELEFKKAEIALQQSKEQIESQKIIDDANLKKSTLRVKQCEINLDRAKRQLESLSLKAPKAGMVVLQKIYSTNGLEKVKIGDSPWRGMELVSIPDMSTMLVKTTVNETDISRIEKDQRVIITLDAIEGPSFYGKITSVATLARNQEGSDAKVFDVEVTIDSTDERIKPGMTAQCKIITRSIPGVISIPLECVFDKQDTTIVYVKGRGFDDRKVKIGQKNSDYVIILEGVKAGDEVALRDPTVDLEDLGSEGKQEKGNAPGSTKNGGSKASKTK